jgi:4-hydroxybenzoate polyprenyltransferase
MSWLSRRQKWFIYKLISLFSVVRGYNILVIIIAQYFASIFIFSEDTRALDVVLDATLFFIIFASSLVIASGYIINNFYDAEKDLINKPFKSKLDRIVSQETKLRVYFVLNFLVFILAFLVSWRAIIFFSSYIFLVWFYSHKLKKIVFLGNIMVSFLTILPFFAIFLYYKNFHQLIFMHAAYLFILILIKELIKDLESIKGDLSNGYKTSPIVYGERITKNIILGLIVFSVVPVYFLVNDYDIGYMDLYFYLSLLGLIYFGIKINLSTTLQHYNLLHNVIKWIILVGVFCIVLIDPKVVLHSKHLIY